MSTPVRPHYEDREVLRTTAIRLLPRLQGWLKEAGDKNLPDDEELIDDIIKAIKYEDDGYKIAKNLDNEGYFADSSLVDAMDITAHYKYLSYTDALKEWVKANNIETPLNVGDYVLSNRGFGTITSVRPETAQYVIKHVNGAEYVVDAEKTKLAKGPENEVASE